MSIKKYYCIFSSSYFLSETFPENLSLLSSELVVGVYHCESNRCFMNIGFVATLILFYGISFPSIAKIFAS